MTNKLYYSDPEQREAICRVEKIIKNESGYSTVLDGTCFFPEGGGQQSDTGFIDGVKIHYVQEKDGIIYHYSATKPSFREGDNVLCRIDWKKRFSRMQAHTGEHIVSGIVYRRFGYDNVGFHMDDVLMTVDFSGFLTKEQLAEVEEEANRAVYADVPVTAVFPDKTQIQKMSYRSKLENLENPRIVTVEGIDSCACCAPHVKHTGEIGLIKILSSKRHRGGVRITLICGITAYSDYAAKYNDVLKISDMLCAPHDGTADAVSFLLNKNAELKRQITFLCEERIEDVYEKYSVSDGDLTVFCRNFSLEDLRKTAIACRKKCKGISVALCGDDVKGYSYVASSSLKDFPERVSLMNLALSGRGGGRGDTVQGRFSATREEIEKYFNNRTDLLK